MGRKPIAICITDTHAHSNNIEIQENIWNQLFVLAKERGIKRVFHLGDMVHARKAQPLNVLKHLNWIKENIKDRSLDFTGICGNHDKVSLESLFAYPTLYDSDGFNVVEETQELQINDGLSIWFMSYFPETTTAPKILSEMSLRVKKSKKNILCAHQGISGGLSHENATINKELPAESFKAFDLSLLGHYHNANVVEHNGSHEIRYIGSSHATNYGEDNNKGFTIIYDDGSIESINSEFPKFETIDIEVSEISGKWLSNTKKHIASSGNNVRLIVSGDESDLKKLKKQKFSDIGIKKVIRKNDNVSIESVDDKVAFVSLDKKDALKEYRKFCINQEIDPSFGLGYLEG